MSYHRPESLTQAMVILGATGAKVLAGGTDIYPAHEGQILAGEVLDITAIPGLRGISQTGDYWRIGATTTWSEIAAANMPSGFTALQEAARVIGALQVQNAGTIGGNLCNASPAADGVPPLLVLNSEVEIVSVSGTRRVAIGDFLQGVRKVDLRPGEIVSAVLIPKASTSGGAAFEKLGARKYLVISISMVAARVEISNAKITTSAISVGSASPVACRMNTLEEEMIGRDINDLNVWRALIAPEVARILDPIKDIRADAEYRLVAGEELILRAVTRAILAAGV